MSIPVDQCIQLYESGMTVWEIGKLLGYSGTGIYKAMKRANFDKFRPNNPKGRPWARKRRGEQYQAADGRWWVRPIGGGRKRRAVVIAERKFGPILKGSHVHHKDENPSNDNPKNLKVLTAAEHHRLHHLGKKNPKKGHKGELHPKAKLTEKLVKEIFDLSKQGFTQQEIANQMRIHQTTVSHILTGKTWC